MVNIISKVSDKAARDCLVEKTRECPFVDCKVQLELASINGLRSTPRGGFGEFTAENFIFFSDVDS